MREPSPAVVVGRNLNALGIVRSLAAGGVDVVLVCTSRLEVAAMSRHCRTLVVPALGGRVLIEALKEIRGFFRARPVLFLTEEESVVSVTEMGREIADAYHFGLPSRSVTEMLSDKALFQDFATREGLPMPRGRVVEAITDIRRLADFDLPVVVKPADKGRIPDGPGRAVVLATTYAEAAERCRQLVETGAGALVQEWIEGADGAIYFCLFHAAADGTPVAMFTGRKLASFPPRVGCTAICAPAPEAHEALSAITAAMTKRLRMAGMGSLEFKWDQRGRRFVIIEPTVGRSDWQEEIATLAGVNIPLAAWAWHSGAPPVPQASRPARVVWRSSFRHRPPAGEIPPGARVHDGYWRIDDPLPALAYYLLGPLLRMSGRLISALTPRPRWRAPAEAAITTADRR